jgi:hypothetical protein
MPNKQADVLEIGVLLTNLLCQADIILDLNHFPSVARSQNFQAAILSVVSDCKYKTNLGFVCPLSASIPSGGLFFVNG